MLEKRDKDALGELRKGNNIDLGKSQDIVGKRGQIGSEMFFFISLPPSPEKEDFKE